MTAHQVGPYGPVVSNEHRTSPPAAGRSVADGAVPRYEIRVAGRLAPRWSAWFDGLTIATDPDGTTVIRGPVVDQAALHGLIQKLRDVGIPLLALTRLPTDAPDEPPARPNQGEPT